MRAIYLFLIVFAANILGWSQGAAQAVQGQHDVVMGSGELPPGWEVRLDRPTDNLTDLQFVIEGGGYHITTNAPAGIFYKPADELNGLYNVRAEFTQLQKSQHPEAYGLFIGGNHLQSDNQRYIYFLVRQDGKYLIKERDGDKTETIVDWKADPAVNAADSSGKTANLLDIAVDMDMVRFLVNGRQVNSIEKSKLPDTNGVTGLRINHHLDVLVEGFKT
ncbi:MAG: hypothetical protein P8184_21585, partial [Calditrichia bacterium]